MLHLTTSNYIVSQWSGGTTTQIAIAPAQALYADRDFLWRISSAVVELEESDFTPLGDYQRYITVLDGGMVLTHDGGAPITLTPGDIHEFDGGSQTCSVGRCTDFRAQLGQVERTTHFIQNFPFFKLLCNCKDIYRIMFG